jgi:hypothetical protein
MYAPFLITYLTGAAVRHAGMTVKQANLAVGLGLTVGTVVAPMAGRAVINQIRARSAKTTADRAVRAAATSAGRSADAVADLSRNRSHATIADAARAFAGTSPYLPRRMRHHVQSMADAVVRSDVAGVRVRDVKFSHLRRGVADVAKDAAHRVVYGIARPAAPKTEWMRQHAAGGLHVVRRRNFAIKKKLPRVGRPANVNIARVPRWQS